MRPRRAVLTVVVVAALVAVAAAGGDRGPSPVVFPPQHLPLAFSHAQHVGGLGVPCLECHPAAATSRSSLDLLTPPEAPCRRCHDIARGPTAPAATATGACVACHPGGVDGGAVARVVIPPPQLKFSHAAHAATACLTCHARAATADLATVDALPTMDVCLTCHDGRTAARTCTTCHLATTGGRVRTALPDGRLTPRGGVTGADHGLDFARDHAAIARSAPAACAACHAERDCADCHRGAIRVAGFHPEGFVGLHPVAARRDATACTTCHKTQSFCIACHERAGVGPRGATDFTSAIAGREFHPLGWASRDRTGGNRHAAAARANLAECTSCHREESCRSCHSAEVGAPAISPHGPGWRGSARCRAIASKNPRVCLKCHVQLTPVGCD